MQEGNGSKIKEVIILIEKGFTLVEVIISIFIIGIIMVAISPMFYQGLSTVISFSSKTDAVNEARKTLIDDLKGTGTTTPSSITIKFIDTSTDPDTELASITSSAYSVKRDFSLPGKGEETLELIYYTYPISP